MNDNNDIPSVFSKDAYQPAPWWVPCLLAFLSGLAIPSALLISDARTPDYRRGHAAGYREGRNDENVHRDWYDLGWGDHARGAKHRFDH